MVARQTVMRSKTVRRPAKRSGDCLWLTPVPAPAARLFFTAAFAAAFAAALTAPGLDRHPAVSLPQIRQADQAVCSFRSRAFSCTSHVLMHLHALARTSTVTRHNIQGRK